jgi:3-hydroxyisobutyrate dehydrogenase-like beta-hydroxyacid dehydrogenase
MGSAMAPNLVAAGPHPTVWDRSEQATAALAGAGVPVVATPPPTPAARP